MVIVSTIRRVDIKLLEEGDSDEKVEIFNDEEERLAVGERGFGFG
jgi:hypothetical protein